MEVELPLLERFRSVLIAIFVISIGGFTACSNSADNISAKHPTSATQAADMALQKKARNIIAYNTMKQMGLICPRTDQTISSSICYNLGLRAFQDLRLRSALNDTRETGVQIQLVRTIYWGLGSPDYRHRTGNNLVVIDVADSNEGIVHFLRTREQ